MLTRLLACLFIVLLTASCGSKKSVVPVKLKILQSSITASGPFDGGVLLMGKSDDGKNSFRMGVTNTSNEISLELARGKWEFAAISWEGNDGPLTGNNRCAYTGFVNLAEAEATVTFSFSTSRCLNLFNGRQFVHNEYREASGRFLHFYPYMCLSGAMTVANCNPSSGVNHSNFLKYKVVYESSTEGGIKGSVASISSNCLPMHTTPRTRVPVTDAGTDSPLGFKLLFYTDVNCMSVPVVYDFEDGVRNNQEQAVSFGLDYATNYYSYLMINPGAAHNFAPIEPSGYSVTGMSHYDGTYSYFNTLSFNYNLAMLPAGVSSICFTENTCSAGQWMAPMMSGTATLPATSDGTKTIKLFFRTSNGVISTSYSSQSIILDRAAPILTAPSASGTVSGGVNFNYTLPEPMLNAQVMIYESNCSTLKKLENIAMPPAGNYNPNYTTGELSGGLTVGNTYCIRIQAGDLAGNQSMSPTSTFTVSI